MEAEFSQIASSAMAELLGALMTNNARFSHLCLQMRMDYELEGDKPAAKKLFATHITQVFDNVRRPCAEPSYTFDVDAVGEDIPRLQLGAVHLDCRGCPNSRFEAFCSAMVVNQTTTKLSIKLKMKPKFGAANPVRTRHRWKWIAYAFFSKRARACSTLKSLALMRIGSMSVVDMEGFTAVVKSDHPDEELFDRPRGLIKPRDATLKSGAPILWKFDDQGEPNLDWDPITFDAAVQFVRTFSDDGTSTWVDAIIPGLGRCQVLRDDLKFQPPTKDYTGVSSDGVTSLQIGFAEDDGDLWEGLPMFLAAVGSSLTFLGLDYHQAGLEGILQHCPNLQELTFGAGIAFFRFNFSDYDGKIDQFDYDWRYIEAFAQALSDSTSPLARCLRRMRVRLNAFRDGRDDDGNTMYDPCISRIIVKLQRVLEVNQRLKYLDVHLPPPYHDCIDELRAYHLKPIGRPRASLSMECKLSLLSVILSSQTLLTPDTAHSVKLAGRDLDQFTLSNILEYAAPTALRQVFARKVLEEDFRSEYEDQLI
ncbi:hypothetical protein PHYSODRAFT_288802 [Phytophthora sojae]|uniref:Uncharacterized protein n=1 Tax=Phytophthora sojae (strain P6497) TaxID=1094619 RepID=G5A894_PHYSP|nr:hypothetical protein PHYSODRAFT_288802 [Phytophthora sojae]EGZ08120.1 hypothetical protein PHYSODRAFT_288802 [Phytophthora sojae]|eukprot:XP_009536292.1 hypothetical protein PHYSODRAFT_288802 [Phytophthora sojae]